jgi:F0F1-type ATP synthase assembly protein I
VPDVRKKNDFNLVQGASLGLELFVALGLGALLGHFADQWLSTSPLLLVIGCVLGAAAGMVRIVRTVSGLQARGKAAEPDERDPPRP